MLSGMFNGCSSVGLSVARALSEETIPTLHVVYNKISDLRFYTPKWQVQGLRSVSQIRSEVSKWCGMLSQKRKYFDRLFCSFLRCHILLFFCYVINFLLEYFWFVGCELCKQTCIFYCEIDIFYVIFFSLLNTIAVQYWLAIWFFTIALF